MLFVQIIRASTVNLSWTMNTACFIQREYLNKPNSLFKYYSMECLSNNHPDWLHVYFSPISCRCAMFLCTFNVLHILCAVQEHHHWWRQVNLKLRMMHCWLQLQVNQACIIGCSPYGSGVVGPSLSSATTHYTIITQ